VLQDWPSHRWVILNRAQKYKNIGSNFSMKLKFLNLSNVLILFSILGAWYLTSVLICPYLHFSFQQIGFLTSYEFFKSFSSYPGGIADYIACFISQFFSFNKFGSFLIVMIASLQGLIVLRILKSLSAPLKYRLLIFTSILLMAIVVQLDYRYPYYASIRLLLAFIFTMALCIVYSKIPKYSAYIWLLMAFLLFYLANGAALIVFALSTSVIFGFENKIRLRYLYIPAFLVLAVLIPYLGYKFFFQITLLNVFNITMVKPPVQLAYTQGIPLYVYYSLLPVILLVVFTGERIFKPLLNSEPLVKPKKGQKTIHKVKFYNTSIFTSSIQVLVIGLSGYFLVSKYHDPFKKKLNLIEYYAENEKWNEVLKTAESIEKYDFRVNFQVNRAYSHLGYLPDRLFGYPQLLGIFGLFFEPKMMVGNSDMPTSDLYFDLGFMNESQHWAFEAETLLPHSPRILKRLVLINLVNRKYDLASEFLNVLDRNMLCHQWVEKYQRYVSDTTLAAKDELISQKRKYTPKKALVNVGVLESLKLLFETNPNNRMAYDYLLTYFILDQRLTDFLEYLKYYPQLNKSNLPGSWEEALSIYILKTRTFPPFYTDKTISKNCMQRLTRFNEVMKSYKNDLQAAKSTLSLEFGESFWYYMLYLSPKVTNVLNNKVPIQ
jgi:hypothetical protein